MNEPLSLPATILLAEDDPHVRAALVRALEQKGHTVMGVGSGRLAVQALGYANFDLVITDLLMPDGDGLEVLMHIMTMRPRPAVITMSGGGDFMTASQALSLSVKLGAQSPLVKPFSPDQLTRAVDFVLRNRVPETDGE
jgi:DNA-binding NtrC family response regulator